MNFSKIILNNIKLFFLIYYLHIMLNSKSLYAFISYLPFFIRTKEEINSSGILIKKKNAWQTQPLFHADFVI